MVDKTDAYVTPKPDPRLNLLHSFTLSKPLDATSTVIPIEESPRLCTMDDGKRLLKIQNEIVSYKQYSTNPPYQFEGCERGALGTQASAHEMSSRVGLLDMYYEFVRFTQNTSIQAEIAKRLQDIYEQAGFKFLYFDGAEQVPAPYWYTIARAQEIMYEPLQQKPLFSEGSCKAHFSWHILSRGNAFDIAKPEVMKAATRAYPAAEIQRAVNDFTGINFGWIGYWSPSQETIGTQPDMLEYVTSRAAAWDCPISMQAGKGDLLLALESHPRTPDNMEVIKRWEEVRDRTWLTQKQKLALRDLQQEHTLLIDENGKFALVPCDQIDNAAGAKAPVRAFIFEYKKNIWVSYWHPSGEASLEIPLSAKQMTLMRELGKPLAIRGSGNKAKLPLGERRYLKFSNLPPQDVIVAFQNAKVI
jgi:hypothetical protein